MKNKILISGIIISIMIIFNISCTKDLNVTPIDPNLITSANIGNSQTEVLAALAKVYASFILPGQANGNTGGYADISSTDDNFYSYQRPLWNLQELPTDEAACAWGDAGVQPLSEQQFEPSNPFLTALYDRTVLTVNFANSVVNVTKGSTDANFIMYNAEARYLRALSYYFAMDLFGNPAFITENSPIGDVYPKQINPKVSIARPLLFNYIVGELRSIAHKLGNPGFSYPRADRAACWMLLAKCYLNAQVYTGTAKWDSCKLYCDSVLNNTGGVYQLATNYRRNFGSNNGYPGNPEMIFAWECDGVNTQAYVGSTFIISSCSDGVYINGYDLGLTSTNWAGNRGKLSFLNELIDTVATYGNNPMPAPKTHMDSIYGQCPDQRVYLHTLLDNQMYNTSEFDNGIGVYKFTNNQVQETYSLGGANDNQQAVDWNSTFSSTDVPIFRLADAYLMRAESEYNLGDLNDALTDINVVRARAHATPATLANLNDPLYILYERGREFYYEAQRRTDLIRFGQFVSGSYNWSWKGGTFNGTNLGNPNFNIFPLPQTELTSNPNITQNPGY